MKISELMMQGSAILRENGIPSAVLDAQLLLGRYLNADRMFIVNNRNCDLEEYDGYFDLISRRAAHEPIAYILNTKEFMGIDFYVDKNVLIPRPDTETLAERMIEKIGRKRVNIIDIGTGSGCISVSILKNCPHCRAVGADISEEAIKIAEKNAAGNGVAKRFKTVNCDILKEIPEGSFDVIVSNPPYIEPEVIAGLEPDVKDYEPYGALCGGADGLDFYRRISEIGKKILKPKYLIAFEVGYNQSEAVTEILKKDGYENIAAVPDLAGIQRVVTAQSSKF